MEFLAGNRIRGLNSERTSTTTTTADIVWNSTTVHGMSISTNTASTTNTGWTAGVQSNDTWTVGDSEISITWTASGAHIQTGFGKDPFVITSPNIYNFQEMEYRMYNGTSGTEIYTYDSGSIGGNHGSWTSSNVMKMTMSTTGVVTYYKDGTLLTTSTNPATIGDTYYVHAGGTNNSGATNNLEITTSGTTNLLPNIEDGSIFYETDTNKSYVLNSGTWTEV
jgi:hypothetical protein